MEALTATRWQPQWDWAAACAALAAADPTLRPILHVPLPARPVRDLFGQLVRAICAQQVSVASADAVERRLWAAAGGAPTPRRVLVLPEPALRAAGLSERKAGYVRVLAQAAADGRLDPAMLAAEDDEAVIGRLTALPGIGRWTAEMALLFGLHRADVWPADDLGIRAAVGLLDETPIPSPKATAGRGERWRPHRSTAALILWAWRRTRSGTGTGKAE